MIQIDAVGLISIFVECVLYGISIVLYTIAMIVLLRRRKGAGLNKPMFAAILVMFTLGTIHVSIDLRRLMIAFLYSPQGPKAYLAEISTTLYIIRSTAYVTQTLTGDGFVLYRLFLVWNGDKRVFYPLFVTFIVSIAIGIGALRSVAVACATCPIFESRKWVASFYAMTLFTNSVCSSLLAARIWWINRQTAQLSATVSDRSVVTAAIIVIESGAIYSLCLSIQLTLYLLGTFAQYILIDTAAQLVGIVFSLIIVRVGLGLTVDVARTTGRGTRSLLPSLGTGRTGRSGRRAHPTDTFALDTVEVHITKVTHDDEGASVGETFQLASAGAEKQEYSPSSYGTSTAA